MSKTVIDGVDYGPLAGLVGKWEGDQGLDVAPDKEGTEHNPYFETIDFFAAGKVSNAEEQTLAIVRYHQVVSRKSDQGVFHDQIGYWLWDGATEQIIQTLTIPRAVTLLAGGSATVSAEEIIIEVKAEDGDPEWGIQQSPFMKQKACTKKFSQRLTLKSDELQYKETTVVDIYGKESFIHTDQNVLTRMV